MWSIQVFLLICVLIQLLGMVEAFYSLPEVCSGITEPLRNLDSGRNSL